MATGSNSTTAGRQRAAEPRLSVLTPSYGYARFIGDAIASIEAQSLRGAVEHVIADGASTDGTVDVLREHPKVRWISEPDRGQSDALNRCLAMSRAPLVGWLNADEFYLPGSLSRALREFEDPGVDVVYGDAVFVDEDGRFLRVLGQHRFSGQVLKGYGPYIPSCSLFIRRSVLGEAPWDVDCRRVMDWDLFLRLAGSGASFRYVPYPFGAFRVHDARVTARPIDERVRSEHARVRARYSLPDPDRRLGRARIQGARLAHRLMKLRSGSWLREVRLRDVCGADLRWWRWDADHRPLVALGISMVGNAQRARLG